MGLFKQLCLSWIILSAACVSCQELTSTLCEGNRTCPGEKVIFTCTIRGSSALEVLGVAWSSTEYIGQGDSLQLSTANMIGEIETSTGMDGNVTATATVTNNTNVDGELILESTLRITAVEPSTVTCRDPNGGSASIGFTVSAVPGIPQMISAAEVSRHAENICVILVIWSRPTNSDASDIAYIVYVPSRHIKISISSSTILSTVTVPDCDDDIRVQVAAVNGVGCVGMNSSEVQPILLDIPFFPTKDVSATTGNGSATSEGGSVPSSSPLGAGAIAGITIGGFALGAVLCAVSILLCCIVWRCVRQLKQGTGSTGGSRELHVAEISKDKFVSYLALLYEALKQNAPSSVQVILEEANKTLQENVTKEVVGSPDGTSASREDHQQPSSSAKKPKESKKKGAGAATAEDSV